MSEPVAKGRCPGLFQPMQAADGWLVRVKPPGAALSATAALSVAEAVQRFGNGTIELTSRANLQVRGLAPEGTGPFAATIVSAGLADPDPVREGRRRVIHAPLAGADPTSHRDTARLAASIEAALAEDTRLAFLPAKFAVVVDGGGILPLGETGADVRVMCTDARWMLAPAGSPLGAYVTDAEATDATLRLALAFVELASACSPAPRRMRTLVSAVGSAALLAATDLHDVMTVPPRPAPRAIGWLPYPDGARGAFGLGLPFGTMTASTLAGLAELAAQYGDTTLRLTPWRAFVLPHITRRDAPRLRTKTSRLGLIVDPGDPRLAITACIGRPGCAAASVDARADAALLLKHGLATAVHISGCAKGCGHPEAAPIMLVGEEGRYGIVRSGRPGDAPSARGLTMPEVIAALVGSV